MMQMLANTPASCLNAVDVCFVACFCRRFFLGVRGQGCRHLPPRSPKFGCEESASPMCFVSLFNFRGYCRPRHSGTQLGTGSDKHVRLCLRPMPPPPPNPPPPPQPPEGISMFGRLPGLSSSGLYMASMPEMIPFRTIRTYAPDCRSVTSGTPGAVYSVSL